jgi:hypothetical protein
MSSQSSKLVSFIHLPGKQRVVYLSFSLLFYLFAVSNTYQHNMLVSDTSGCASYHGIQFLLIFVSGLLLGGGIGGWPETRVEHPEIARPQPSSQNGSRTPGNLSLAAWAILISGMVFTLLWTIAPANQFVDAHKGLVVEVDFLIVLMGFAVGNAWLWLLHRRAWVGFVISVCTSLMVTGNVLVSHGWC